MPDARLPLLPGCPAPSLASHLARLQQLQQDGAEGAHADAAMSDVQGLRNQACVFDLLHVRECGMAFLRLSCGFPGKVAGYQGPGDLCTFPLYFWVLNIRCRMKCSCRGKELQSRYLSQLFIR